jgi:hypothetical protein
VEKFVIWGEQTEEELIQRAREETGILQNEIQVRDSLGRRITNPMRGQTAWIHYGGLKGGGEYFEEHERVWLTINFEERQHHMWVDRKEHIRDIMLRKRYNKAAVAPVGLKGKLEGPWNTSPVVKLIRRPDVQGEPIRLPKKAQEWDRESRKVMMVVKFQGYRRRAKEIPCEMPLKEVIKWFHFSTKKATVRAKIQPPWTGWTEITVMPKPGVSECRLKLRERIEGKFMGKVDRNMKEDLRELHREKVRKTLMAMEENLKDADDQELRDIGEKL